MINVTHFSNDDGWEFESDKAGLAGGGRTLSASVAAAERAARVHFSAVRGAPVPLDRARRELRHRTGSRTPAAGLAA